MGNAQPLPASHPALRKRLLHSFDATDYRLRIRPDQYLGFGRNLSGFESSFHSGQCPNREIMSIRCSDLRRPTRNGVRAGNVGTSRPDGRACWSLVEGATVVRTREWEDGTATHPFPSASFTNRSHPLPSPVARNRAALIPSTGIGITLRVDPGFVKRVRSSHQYPDVFSRITVQFGTNLQTITP